METPYLCPMSPIKMQHSKWELGDLLEMELHIATETNCQHTQLNTWVLSEPFEGSTPLLMACDRGNFESVKHIVEKWQMDVNETAAYYYQCEKKSTNWHSCVLGTYYFYDCQRENTSSKIKKRAGASPLFVAAYAGHFAIVQYLLEKGARFDIKTSYNAHDYLDHSDGSLAGLNPLHGALSSLAHNERLGITRILLEAGADPSALTSNGSPIWTMRSCGSDEITLLIEHGMSLTQRRRKKRQTVLHYWASEFPNLDSSVKVVQLLLDRGVDFQARDDQNLTPYLAAAQSFDENHECTSLLVFDFLSEREEIDRMEKIDALEIAGAVILGSQHPSSRSTARAFGYWRLALLLRGTHPKRTLVLKTVPYTEWKTEADLEEIENNSTQQKIHSLLVQLRIYSTKPFEFCFLGFFDKLLDFPPHSFCSDDYRHEDGIAVLRASEQTTEKFGFINRVLDFWRILLEVVQQRFDIRLEKNRLFLIKLVHLLVSAHFEYFEDPHLNSLESWKTSLELILKKNLVNIPADMDGYKEAVWFHVETLHQLFSILVRLPPEILNDEKVMSLLKKMVHYDNYNGLQGNSLLLMLMEMPYECCFHYDTNANRLPIVALLLKSGADPNSFDSAYNNPLHILLRSKRDDDDTDYDNRTLAIADLLLKSGADPNSIDGYRRSPLHLLLLFANRHHNISYILAMADLLLKHGANPNSMDIKRNCPLHLLALLQDKRLDPVGRLLRDAGTHHDRVNQDGSTVAELWFIARDKKESAPLYYWEEIVRIWEDPYSDSFGSWEVDYDTTWEWSDLPDWCREDDVPNLSCLCANIVQRYGIPYEHKLPPSISAFVEIHGP